MTTPFLALKPSRLAPHRPRKDLSIGNFWLLSDTESANDRLRKLAEWATVSADGKGGAQFVDEDSEGRPIQFQARTPPYNDFRAGEGARATPAVSEPTQGSEIYSMTNILMWSNLEIAKARYKKYKAMNTDTRKQMERLSKLYGIAMDAKPDPQDNGPEQKQFFSLQKRVKALDDVKREAFRRMLSLYLAAGIADENTIAGLVVVDQEDAALYVEVQERIKGIPASQGEGGKRTPPIKDAPITPFNALVQLEAFRDAVEDVRKNYSGNDLLKDYIYADIVSFLYDGAAAMDVYRNYVFMGPSGVGKTTWARLMGKMYKALGIYMYGIVVETTASDYVGAYAGWSGPQTRGMLDGNLENIVLIDEAYAMAQTGSTTSGSNFGTEAITALVDYMDKNRGCIMIIIAGYEDKMKNDFLENNEGLDRRFPNKFVFPAYTAAQMVTVLQSMLKSRGILQLWSKQTFKRMEALIQKCMQDKENRENPTVPQVDANIGMAEFYDELFSKQGGSMENIANQTSTYCALPDKRPQLRGANLYEFDPDMIQVLVSMLDRKHHAGLKENGGFVSRVRAI